MKRKSCRKPRRTMRGLKTLRWRLTVFVFSIILFAGLLTALLHLILRLLFASEPLFRILTVNPFVFTAILLGVCSVLATFLAGYFGAYYLRPLKNLIRATKEVKQGNFKVQVQTVDEHSENEMDVLVNSFNEMVRELDGIELFRNDFINNFSHEFKTPIVSIRGFAAELQQGNLTQEQRQEYARIIVEESDRLAKLSTDVLELSKLENQQILTDLTEFYLDEQLRQCILLFEHAWTEKEIEMIPELEEFRIYSNEEMLSHVWKNLLSNAIKFTPPCGTIGVSLHASESEVTVKISDTGIGMTEEVRSHIFEKFYQGDTSHHHKGYGIGLTMVQRAVQLCGGQIRVESTLGEGSCFSVTLPIRRKKEVIVGELQEN